MAGTPDLFVVCKKCGSEVSPYITECPYCGTRLRKRAPKIDRKAGEPAPRQQRRVPRPTLTPLRSGEIPGIRGDAFGRPVVTAVIVAMSLLGMLVTVYTAKVDVGLVDFSVPAWRWAAAPFLYFNSWYELAVLLAIGIFGWRLELRHGPILVIALFIACGIGGDAIAVAAGTNAIVFGAPGAALGMLAAWALPDIVRARNGIDHDGDLIGTAVIAAVVLLMPAVVPFASITATVAGGVLGLLCGAMLLRVNDTTR
jgi:membrane associated rhomboid family serine protease